jgi:hypothetical protein
MRALWALLVVLTACERPLERCTLEVGPGAPPIKRGCLVLEVQASPAATFADLAAGLDRARAAGATKVGAWGLKVSASTDIMANAPIVTVQADEIRVGKKVIPVATPELAAQVADGLAALPAPPTGFERAVIVQARAGVPIQVIETVVRGAGQGGKGTVFFSGLGG